MFIQFLIFTLEIPALKSENATLPIVYEPLFLYHWMIFILGKNLEVECLALW